MEREFIYSIQRAIDYIEDNLKNDISNRQITSAIGYYGAFSMIVSAFEKIPINIM